VPVPRGYPAFSVREAEEAAQKLGGSVWVVKAQIHAGGRGKGGGVKLARSMGELTRRCPAQILGMQLKTHQTGPEGQKVRRLLHRGRRRHPEGVLRLAGHRPRHAEGGLHRQQRRRHGHRGSGAQHAREDHQGFIDPLAGLTDAQAKRSPTASACPPNSTAQAIDVFKKLYTCYMATDASLVEINPLNRDSKGNIKALDAKFNFDATPCSATPRSWPTATWTRKTRPRSRPASST
jgi:succinyl-CoA synthetase beta subunit